jgi:hypothetical protein
MHSRCNKHMVCQCLWCYAKVLVAVTPGVLQKPSLSIFVACSKYPARFACCEISVSLNGYDYLPIVLQHHKHGSPPRATPPRSWCTRAAPPLPNLTTHVASDGYAVVIGNWYKHKRQTAPRPRPDHTTMPIYAATIVKIRMHKRATHTRPHHDPSAPARHPHYSHLRSHFHQNPYA